MLRPLRSALVIAAVAVASLTAGAATAPAPGDDVFGLTTVHKIEITIPAGEWNVLQTSSARGGTGVGGSDEVAADGRIIHTGSGFRGYFPYAHGDISFNGQPLKDIGIRYKGNLSFSSSSAAAPLRANFKLKLDLFTKQDWKGLETLNLHAGVVDTTLMREPLAYAVFRAAGVPAPRTAYADVMFTVPGTFTRTPGGRYVLIENVNKEFLKTVLPPGTGLVLKPEGLRGGITSYGDSWDAYEATYRPARDATAHERQRLIEFAKVVTQPDVALFRAQIGHYLDVESFLRYLAVNAFLSNWDSYLNGSHNFYLYLDPRDDKFRFLPWDEDLALGARMNNGLIDIARPIRNNNDLIYFLLDDPTVAARYHAILEELSTTAFSRTALTAIIEQLEKTVGTPGDAVRSFLDSRLAALQQALATP